MLSTFDQFTSYGSQEAGICISVANIKLCKKSSVAISIGLLH